MLILNIRKKRTTGNENKKIILCFLLIVHCSLLTVNPLFAEHKFSLRIAPAIEVPINNSLFSPGFGADASLDWAFLRFARNFETGLSAGGAFSNIPAQAGDPIFLLEGKGGLFLRWSPLDRFTFQTGVNGGVYQYSRNDESDLRGLYGAALGMQFHLSPYLSLYTQGDYTYRFFGSQPLNTISVSAGLRFNLSEIMGNKTRVDVEKTQQYRVFPVSFAWYEHNPVAMVTVTNEEPNAITDVSLSFFMEGFLSQPWTFALLDRLGAGESIDLPVTALFNEAMMSLTETINANGTFQIQYRSLGARKEAVYSVNMPIFHRNTLSWDDDRRAAAFVSPKDAAARYFARYVASALSSEQLAGTNAQLRNIPPNVLTAVALFETLRLYGITYVIVPATSFASVSADESVLDNVSYPYQALYYRGGDCSYLSILFCSMLEALGIESAFITIPGHIYVAVEVGNATWNARSADIIELDGKRWLPIEITIPNEGFTRAWRIGANQWRKYLALGEAQVFPIREAWEVYPSVTVPASGDHLPEMPEWENIIRAVEGERVRMGR